MQQENLCFYKKSSQMELAEVQKNLQIKSNVRVFCLLKRSSNAFTRALLIQRLKLFNQTAFKFKDIKCFTVLFFFFKGDLCIFYH